MKEQDKSKVGRRDFLRAVGAGAGLAVTAATPLATGCRGIGIRCRQKEGPVPGEFHRRADLLQSQPISELREAEPC